MELGGEIYPISPQFEFVDQSLIDGSVSRLATAIEKYQRIVSGTLAASTGRKKLSSTAESLLTKLELRIRNQTDLSFSRHPSLETDYSYRLTVSKSSGVAVAEASSQYGLMYAMETFSQLIDRDTGALRASEIAIDDMPFYKWRGLMLDAGRRFVPVPTVKNLIDTMAAVKLNVLHLHASDMCRFGVESKKYPNLTASLTGIHAGFYTQEDIKDLVEYASGAGVRVVPEVEHTQRQTHNAPL